MKIIKGGRIDRLFSKAEKEKFFGKPNNPCSKFLNLSEAVKKNNKTKSVFKTPRRFFRDNESW